jgi:hypothetical protein
MSALAELRAAMRKWPPSRYATTGEYTVLLDALDRRDHALRKFLSAWNDDYALDEAHKLAQKIMKGDA